MQCASKRNDIYHDVFYYLSLCILWTLKKKVMKCRQAEPIKLMLHVFFYSTYSLTSLYYPTTRESSDCKDWTVSATLEVETTF